MNRLRLLVVSFFACTPLFAWTTRPGWPAVPSQNNARIQCALARGDADHPSAVFPLCEPGRPVACWWDDDALHVGSRTFGFNALGVAPKDGASFSVDVVADSGKKMRLDVVLDEDAAAYRVPDFGILGNRTIDLPVTISAKRDGSVRVFSPNPRFLYALFSGKGRRLLMLLNDTDEEVMETVSVKRLASSGKDIFNGRMFDFTSGRCDVRLPPRESLCILFE